MAATRIAYILLCHKDPAAVVAQARRLTAAGDAVAIHFDAGAPRSDYERLHGELREAAGIAFPERRHRCGWGEWSLVAATLDTLRCARDSFPDATHFYLVSGDCMPIKPAAHIHARLGERPCDRIESHDFFASDWIRTGWTEERLIYRHWFNERRQPMLFYTAFELQRRLRLTRAVPSEMRICIGSQWWCLRRRTVGAILDFLDRRPDIVRFFRWTWIPDETVFQTLVRHLVPRDEIDNRAPTFLMFTDYGMPVTFHDDHYDLLTGQDAFFARKIGPEAQALKARLGALYASGSAEMRITDEGRRMHAFLTGQGRIGRRFAPRFWEAESLQAQARELLIVVAAKRVVAKRLVARLRDRLDLACLAFVFDEADCPLPDLGGVETSLGKRHRHRRALVRLLFDRFGTQRLLFCVDPAQEDLLVDFGRDRSHVRFLEIETAFDEADLAAHAIAAGYADRATAPATLAGLLPAVRNDLAHQSDRIAQARLDTHIRLRQGDTAEDRMRALATFLRVDPALIGGAVAADDLFDR